MPEDKRLQRAENTKQQIIDAAEQLFQEKGFAATSMSEVAHRAGVTKSLIHHHFGSKELLWDAVCMRNQQRMKAYLASILSPEEDGSSGNFLSRVVERFFRHIGDNPGFSRLQTWVAAEGRSQRSMQLDTVYDLEKRIADCQQDGEIRDDIDPRFIIFTYWSLVEHWHSNKHIYAKRFGCTLDGSADEEYLETALTVFLDGLKKS